MAIEMTLPDWPHWRFDNVAVDAVIVLALRRFAEGRPYYFWLGREAEEVL